MRVVNIPNYGPVSFPDGTPDEEINARVARFMAAQQQKQEYTPDYRDLGIGQLVSGGFKRAASSLGSTVTDLLPALGGAMVGNEKYAREQLAEAAEKRRQAELANPTGYKSYKDVRGLGDAAGFVAETVGELGPDILGLLTGAGVGASVGKRIATKGVEETAGKLAVESLAKKGLTGEALDAAAAQVGKDAVEAAAKKGAARGTMTGLYGSSVGLNAPDTFQNIFEKTGNLEPGIALAFGAAQGVLDTYLPSKILSQLGSAGRDRLAGEIVKRSSLIPDSAKVAVAKELAKTTAGEATTEALQEALGILAEKTAGAKGDFLSSENVDRLLNSAIKGAIGGGTFGAPGAIVEGRRSAQLQREEADRRTEAEGQPPAPPTGGTPKVDYNVPAYMRRAGTQTDMFQGELDKARGFSMDEVAKATPDSKGATYAESVEAAKLKLKSKGTSSLTADELNLLRSEPDTEIGTYDEGRQMSLFEDTGEKRAKRQAEIEESFKSAEPDLLGDVLPPTEQEASLEPVPDPRVEALIEKVRRREALAPDEIALLQGRVEEAPISADPRQGALQFAAPAPEGRGFREEPFNTQMPDQLQEKVSRDSAFRQAEQEAAAQKQAETVAAENQRQLQLAEPPAPPAPPAPAPREQVQESFPGMGVRYGDKVRANQEAAKAEATPPVSAPAPEVISQDMLTGFGVLPAAPLRKRLVGKDLSNPTDRAQVQRELSAYAKNEAVPPESREKVNQFLQSPLFMEQTAMFGPKGGATAAATRKETPRVELKPIEPVPTITGEGVSVPSRPAEPEAPAGTPAPRDGGVDVSTSGTGQTGVRAEPKQGTLKTVKFEPVALITPTTSAPAPKAEGKKPTKAKAEAPSADEQADLQAELDAEMGQKTEVKAEKPKAEKPEVKVEKPKAEKPEVKAEKPKAEKPVEKPVEKVEPKKEAKAEKPAEKSVGKSEPKNEQKDVPEDIGEVKVSQARAGSLFERIKAEGYGIEKNDVDAKDVNRATLLKVGKTKLTATAQAAKLYFSKVPRVVDAMRNIAFDVVYDTPRFRRGSESKAEADFFQGMNGENAKLAFDWIRANMSSETNAQLDKLVQEYQRQQRMTTDEALVQLFSDAFAGKETVDATIQSYIDAQKGETKKIKLDAVQSAGLPLHPSVVTALKGNDVQGALRLLAASTEGPISQTASALIKAKITPKVVVEKNLTDENGERVPGYYDPKTDTVYLDAELGLNPHVLFHELGHAATSHVIENKAHPLTKQLTQLFDDVKGSLDTAYGSTSLDEFVAEAWANEEFKGKLNSINPKGEKITAWQRFTNAIVNYFRKLMGKETKGIESAYDVADRLIQAILSPAPEGRNGPMLYAAVANPKSPIGANWLDQGVEVAMKLGVPPQLAAKAHEFLKNSTSGVANNILLSTLPLHALSDVAKKYLPRAVDVDRVVGEKSGDEYARTQRIEPVINEAERWAKDNKQLLDKFNRIVYDSTINEVDPSVPRETYEKIKDKETREAKLKEWDAMQADWKNLGPGGRQVYTRMRDTYAAMYEEVKKAIGAKIDSATDADTAKTIKNEIYAKLAERGHVAPYFPLTRNGDYWLSYTAKNAQGQPDFYVMAFETEYERTQVMKQLEKAKAENIRPYKNIGEISYKDAPATSFVNGVLKTLEVNKVDAKAREEILRLFLNTLPETSFAQAFQRRQNRLGFNRDAVRAFREKSMSMARQLTNMTYASKLIELRDQLKADVKAIGQTEDNRVAAEYYDELKKRIDFAVSPTTNLATQMLSSLGFNYLLGFNISSAAVNLTQVPLIVLPYLGGKYNYGDASKAIQEAYQMYAKSGFDRNVTIMSKEDGKDVQVNERAMPALDNYYFSQVKDARTKRLQTLAEEAARAGQLNRSMFYDILEVDGSKNPLSVINGASSFAFHHGERMNRQVTMIAAYNLELDSIKGKLNKRVDPDSKEDTRTFKDLSQKEQELYAARQAIYATEMTNGGTSAASAPRIAQGSIGKVLFMFKRYGVQMYYMLFKMTREMLQNQDPAVKKQAMKQLAGVYGSAAIFSGLQGLPLFGVAAMIYNMFKDDDEEDFGTAVRAYTGELAYKGLVNQLTNLDIASRVGLGDLIFRDNKMSSGSASLAETVAETLGGPVYGIATKIDRGVKMMLDGEVMRGLETAAPTAVGNLMRSYRFATEGANTLRGDPIVGDIAAGNVFAQLFGFAPADYTKQLEINATIKGIDKYVNETATKLRRQYNIADRTYDFEKQMDVREKLEKLYSKHPSLGDLDTSLIKSKAAFEKQTPLMYNGITISPKLRDELLELAADLED